MKNEIGVAVIGCGVIVPAHLRALEQIPDVKVRVLCDILPERAEKYAAQCGAEVCTDAMDVIARPDIDIVEICTPHHQHTHIVLAALAAGKRVLCEKPMAISLRDAEMMIEKGDNRLSFVYQNRYNTPVVEAKRIIAEDELGPMKTLRAFVCWDRKADYYAKDAWRGTWDMEGGGSLINQAIHTIDLINHLAGPVVSVKGSYTTDLLQGIVDVDENTHSVMKFQSGIIGLLHTSNSFGITEPPEISMVFEKATLRIYGDTLTLSRPDNTSELLVDETVVVNGVKAIYGNGHAKLIPDFYRCVRDGKPFWINPQEAYHSLWTVLSIYQSSRTNAWVSRKL